MNERFLNRTTGTCLKVLAIISLLGVAGLALVPAGDNPKRNDAKNAFGPTKVWTMHLEIPAQEFEAMQPAAPTFPGAPRPPQPKEKKGQRESERNQFGTAFPWAL